MRYIGIDIGGMSAKAGLVNEFGEISHKRNVVTDKGTSSGAFISDMAHLTFDLLADAGLTLDDIDGIGLGFPGSIDDGKGIVRYCCNLNLRNVEFVKLFKSSLNFKKPIMISNDANCAVLAEAKFGAAKGAKDVILFTLGTGIGTGIISGGRLITGNASAGSEGGHTTLVIGGEPCGCGRNGCFEAYASATALLRQTKQAAEKNPDSLLAEKIEAEGLSGKVPFDCATLGDRTALEVVRNYVRYLGVGVVNFCNIFYPETVLLGGGVSNQGDNIVKPLQRFVDMNVYGKEYNPKIKVAVASMGNDAGIIGAAALCLQ